MQSAPVSHVESLESRTLLAVDVSVVMSGLDNPRGLEFAPNGDLYVAEAGRGGGPNAPSIVPQPGTTAFYGPTGAISRLKHGHHGQQERVVGGLPSIASADGSRATGPADISWDGDGKAFATIGFGGNPAIRAQLGAAGDDFAQLIRFKGNGKWDSVTDLGTYEATANPDGRLPDTNPFGVLAKHGGKVVLVDSGGNSLLGVDKKGNVTTLAVLPRLTPAGPPFSGDPVPTSVVVGPDGAYYVGILSGAPFVNGVANVYRIVPGQTPSVFRSGFKTIIDIDFDRHGNLYVLEHSAGPANGLAAPGDLIRVAPDGTRTTVIDGLVAPTSVAIGPDRAFYISTHGTSPGLGEVVRVTETDVDSHPPCGPGGKHHSSGGADEDDDDDRTVFDD